MLAAGAAAEVPARPSPLVYPQHDPGRVPQWHYMQEVIKLAITRSGASYELVESPIPMTQARVVRELADRSGRIDLTWTMTSIEREAQMLPVRVPMDRGLQLARRRQLMLKNPLLPPETPLNKPAYCLVIEG